MYDNFKTQMCKNYNKSKKCPYSNCTYAHGEKELNYYLYGTSMSASDDDDEEESSEEEKVSEKSANPEVIPPPKVIKPAPKLKPVDLNKMFSKYPDNTKLEMLEKQQK